jgi:hypothetical protein
MKLLMKKAGAGVPSANRITLLRDTKGTGSADTRTVFLQGLNSPFGMVLVGNDLYVACTDAILRFPYTAGATQITRQGEKIVDLPAGTINHHWTKNVIASRDWIAPVRHGRLQQQRRRERDRGGRESRRHPRGRSRHAPLPRLRVRACATPTAWTGSPRPGRSGPSSTSATSSAAISFPTT